MKMKLMTSLVAAVALLLILLTAGIETGYGRQQYGGGQQFGGAQNSGTPAGARIEHIFDPALGMDYMTVPIPEDWTFQGGLVRQTSCMELVTSFYRTSSPDGLSGVKYLPRFDWAWSDNAPYNPGNHSDCLPYDGPIKASVFLDIMINMLHVERVQNLPVLTNHSGGRGQGPLQDTETARAITKFKINSIQEEELLSAMIICNYRAYLPPMRGVPNHVCTANVSMVWSPEGKLHEMNDLSENLMHWRFNPGWIQRKQQISQQQTQQMIGQIVANGQAFRQSMDMRFKQHEEFISQMQSAGDANLKRFNENMNAKQQMSDDWCDAILGQQKRVNPDTGEVYKTDSNYTYDWISDDGRRHKQSNDINFNPNGLGDGNWTLMRNIH